MPAPRPRVAHTLVELLVALTLLGVGAAGVATAFAGDRRLRDLAGMQALAAARARERLESLAAATCVAEGSGASREAWGAESWRAFPLDGAWHLTDSLWLRGTRLAVVVEARVVCPR